MDYTYVLITHGKHKGFKGLFINDNGDGTCALHIFAVGEFDYSKRKFKFIQ